MLAQVIPTATNFKPANHKSANQPKVGKRLSLYFHDYLQYP